MSAKNCLSNMVTMVTESTTCTLGEFIQLTLSELLRLHCSKNRIYSKKKEFAPKGSKFFLLRVDPFSEMDRCVRKQTGC